MKFDPNKHHRRSVRLKGYDYSQPGWYFITICTFKREFVFGNVKDNQMILNEYGKMVESEWIKTSKIRDNITRDEFVVMPNHVHEIIVIKNKWEYTNDDIGGRGTARRAPTKEQFGKPVPGTIPTIIRSFKSSVTKHINIFRNTPGSPVWQRGYHEHVIKNEKELYRIRKYIIENPIKWTEDNYYKR